MPMWKSTSSFCNDPWLFMFNRTGIIKEDLWGQDIVRKCFILTKYCSQCHPRFFIYLFFFMQNV